MLLCGIELLRRSDFMRLLCLVKIVSLNIITKQKSAEIADFRGWKT
jgi:hypothetical protein